MKGNHKSVLNRLLIHEEKEMNKVEDLLQKYRSDKNEAEEVAKLKEEIRRLQEEQQKLKGSNPRGAGRKNKFTAEQIEKIRCDRSEGLTIAELAAKYECSVGLMHKLVHTPAEET